MLEQLEQVLDIVGFTCLIIITITLTTVFVIGAIEFINFIKNKK